MTGEAFVVRALSNVIFFKVSNPAGKVLGQAAFIGGEKNIGKLVSAYVTNYFRN
jgi:hypothetical protein